MGIAGGALERTAADKVSVGNGLSRTVRRGGLERLVKEIGGTDFVILVDDFHYMSKAVQAETAKVLKEGVRQNLKVCTAAALHRADDVVRALPELRGRVTTIDLEYWGLPDLVKVAVQGFAAMNIKCPPELMEKFAIEAAGSPQLMQRICLDACLVMGARETQALEVNLAKTKFPDDLVLDWDEQKQVLEIPDPYFLFYLRWSNRLREE
jgi:hypothetical protein